MVSRARRRSPTTDRLAALRDVDWEQHLRDPSEDTSSLSLLSGFVLGLVVGVIVALLLAPQPGRETREQVLQTGIQLRTRGARRQDGSADASPATLAGEAEQAEVDVLRRMAADETA
jgi:hypothetical protein